MNLKLFKRIRTYKKAGWRVEEDPSGIAMWGIGYLFSPSGNCFSFDEMRLNGGFLLWDVWRDEDIREARRFNRFYRLINKFCSICYIGDGIEKLFENV